MSSLITSTAGHPIEVIPHQKKPSFHLAIITLTLFLCFLSHNNTESEIIELSLPELIGHYTSDTLSRTVTFHLGQPVAEVHQVWIRWTGTISYGTGHGDGVERPVEPWFDWPTQVSASMDTPELGFWDAWFGPAEGSFEDTTVFEGNIDASWDFLRDGTGKVHVGLAPFDIIGGVMVDPPVARLDTVSLIFDVVFMTDVDDTETWGQIKARYREKSESP
jgi:hypothetical protein